MTAHSSPTVDVAVADNDFGFRLLNAVQKTSPNRNVVLSPVSAALNLSMVLNGAAGETRHEMLTALALHSSELEEINTANEQLIKLLRTPTQSVTLSVADSLWVDSRRAKLRPEFVKRMHAAYDAELVDLDFSAPDATRRVNAWASKETQGKIPKVIDQIDPAELLLLTNAVYFKGEWTHKFDKAKTHPSDFTRGNGSARKVQLMSQAGRFEYFETSQMQGIRLPFGAGDLIMEVILPAQSSSLGALEEQLTAEHWKQWRAQYTWHPGTIELPRFELKSNYVLNEALQALGMRRAFQASSAQLTGLLSHGADAGHLSISTVRQSTYWKVDEEGSEAAAVTTTGIRATAVARPQQPFRMIVDRPFFCTIEDHRNGALLFVGTIHDPGG
jgi:serine protease inhibitor